MKKYNIIEVFLEPEGTIFETISLCGTASDHVSKVKVFRGSLHVLAGGEWIPCRLTEPRVRSRFRRIKMSEEQAKYDNKMSFTDAIRILNDFITTDRAIRDFRVESDYDQFCENRCIAIEMLIKVAKIGEITIKQRREFEKEVQKLEKLRNELKQG